MTAKPRSNGRVPAVTDFSRDEAAARAGIDPDTLDELMRREIVMPVSRAVVDASADREIDFTALGQVELKGAPGPIELYVARRRLP